MNSGEASRKVGVNDAFAEDVAFLRRHVDTIVLESGEAKVAVVPAYQGRVMTSTTGAGGSFGWLNKETIAEGILAGAEAEGKLQSHIHVFGGEERFWLGPEGGQFGVYFPPGAAFDFDSWKTPAPIDTEPFDVESRSATEVVFRHDFQVRNHSDTLFEVGVTRRVRIMRRVEIADDLGVPFSDAVRVVGYETENTIWNRGNDPWTRESGALSIWLLGMYKHSKETTVVIPTRVGDTSELGTIVNDEYFGKVPGDRLVERDNVLYFRADGAFRSKIGVTPERALGVAGSYAAESSTLNLVRYERPDQHEGYVNSMWEHQVEPYSGDAINSYNDGAPEPGAAPLGPFYELETSSPAAFLAPGAKLRHTQRTYHIQGDTQVLDQLSRRHLRTGLKDIIDSL